MRAVVHEKYGPPEVLRIEEVERPVPADDEVLVRVHASSVTRTDAGLRSAEYFASRFFTGLLRPSYPIVGMELAGEVEAVGRTVSEFAAGDRVFGIRRGANADYVCFRREGVLAHMPAELRYDQAAGMPDGAISALLALRKTRVGRGRRLVVYGASGSIGTAAVQLAKYLDARVTAVCNTRNLELLRSLGADEVIDYTQEDFTQNGELYDVIFDAVGKHSFLRCRASLSPSGVFIGTDPGFMWHIPLLALATRWVGDRKVQMLLVRYSKADLLEIKRVIEAGHYRPVIDRCYALEDVIEATRYVETGQKTGNVVLRVAS